MGSRAERAKLRERRGGGGGEAGGAPDPAPFPAPRAGGELAGGPGRGAAGGRGEGAPPLPGTLLWHRYTDKLWYPVMVRGGGSPSPRQPPALLSAETLPPCPSFPPMPRPNSRPPIHPATTSR